MSWWEPCVDLSPFVKHDLPTTPEELHHISGEKMRGMYAPFFRRLTLPTSTNADTEVSAIAFDNFARNPNHRIDDYLWEFYNALFIVIGQTEPKLQTGIIDLLLCLRKKSVPRTDDWPSSVKGEVWKDLPTFGWVARDFFNYNTHDDLPKDAQERIINLNAFLAQLTNMTTSKTNLVPESNDDDNPEDPFDFSLFGLWAMRDGLEATPPLGCFPVKLAEVWVQYASDRMKQLCVERKEFPGKQGEPGPWWEEKGWTGFNMQRWAVWSAVLEGWNDSEEGGGGSGAGGDIEGHGGIKNNDAAGSETIVLHKE